MTGGAIVEGLHLPECPRWHEGELWFVDMWGHEIRRGRHGEVVHRFPDDEDPGGLGWLPDGRMLVVGMEGRVVYRFDGDGPPVVHADLRDVAPAQLNDMIVDADGTAWVTQFGFDMWGGAPFALSPVIRVSADGDVAAATEPLAVPNGIAVDGDRLVVAEAGGARISSYRIDGDALVDHQVVELAKAEGARLAVADGICLDADGGTWFADPIGGRVGRLDRHGELTEELLVDDTHPLACVLGGPDRRTLFVTASQQHHKPSRTGAPTGAVLAIEVDAAGTGRP